MKFKSNFLALCGISILPMFIQEVVAYDLHEWGTFTTVSGSDGGVLKGLHVEEEQLPDFVYSHKGMRPSVQSNRLSRGIFVRKDAKGMLIQSRGKGMSSAKLKNVTVKMETPVIYFYGDDTPKVNVKVGFNGGTISQWYPDRTAG